jgi:hypothetical protein
MSDYTKSILDLSDLSKEKINKSIDVYLKSFEKKQDLKLCYNRHLQYFKDGRNPPFSHEDFVFSFRAKDFWKDVDDCGSWLEFRWYKNQDITKLHTANFCKRDKICSACAVRRAYKQQLKFLTILDSEKAFLDKDWYYIVLPVKHSKEESFETVFNRVASTRSRLIRAMRDKRSRGGRGFWHSFAGGMYALEVTHTKNGWNIHLNLLVNAPKGTLIPLSTYKQVYHGKAKEWHMNSDLADWLKSAADDSYQHNIQKLDMSSDEVIRGNLVEILKYSLKFASLSAQETIEVFVKTTGKRLFGTFGNLWGKGMKEDIELSGDEIIDEDFIELIFTRSFDDFDLPQYSLYKREEKTLTDKEKIYHNIKTKD